MRTTALQSCMQLRAKNPLKVCSLCWC